MSLRRPFKPVLAVILTIAPAAFAQPLAIVSNRPGTFVDISNTGTPLNLNNDAEAIINWGVGNALFPPGTVVVANNGGLGFPSIGGQNDLAPLNAPIPSSGAFNGRQAALAYWDDLAGEDILLAGEQRGGKNGNVYWQVIAGNLYVQWHNRNVSTPAAGGDSLVRFQIQVFGGVVPGPTAIYAQYIYDDVEREIPNGGAGATIGYQKKPAGTDNHVMWSFNNPGAVSNGTVLSIVDANAIPTISESGRIVMVLLFLFGGLVIFRGRRHPALAG